MTHNAKGEVIDAHTSWEWSTLCGEPGCLSVEAVGIENRGFRCESGNYG